MNGASRAPDAPAETTPPNDGSWSFQRRWLLVAIVFAAHIGFIFAFGDRKPVVPRPPAPTFMLTEVRAASQLPDLEDPTLFALPHPKGFGGQTWLPAPKMPIQQFRWSEPPRFLPLQMEELEAAFTQFKLANAVSPSELEAKPPAYLTIPIAYETSPEPPRRSTLRLGGDLAGRRWLNPIELPAQPATDLLTNTVVKVMVAADGLVLPPALPLPPGSGSEKADQLARALALAARFTPLPTGAQDPVVGLMIFEWATVPLSETNRPANQP